MLKVSRVGQRAPKVRLITTFCASKFKKDPRQAVPNSLSVEIKQ